MMCEAERHCRVSVRKRLNSSGSGAEASSTNVLVLNDTVLREGRAGELRCGWHGLTSAGQRAEISAL